MQTPLSPETEGCQQIEWSDVCDTAFHKAKEALSKATLLHHPRSNAPTSITVDASNTAIGAQLEQRHGESWVPIAFFSRKLSNTETKYSAFDRELLAAYQAIKHFRHFVEGREFSLYTDHKPLTTAIASKTDRSPRQTRHLSYISEFTTDIRHIRGKFNVVADALSRINSIIPHNDETATDGGYEARPDVFIRDVHLQQTAASVGDLEALAHDQEQSNEMPTYHSTDTGLQLQQIQFGNSNVWCDVSTGVPRPVLPTSWTQRVFNSIHGLSHAGPRPTQNAICQRFVWHGMKRDIRKWCRECHACQSSKFHRHTQAPLQQRPPPDGRFRSLHVDLVGPLPVSQGMTYLFTIIDRFTRWPEVIPIPDAQASTCATALLFHWIARFGIPEDITSDRGAQFTSALWSECHKLLGIAHHNTTSYHPQANGMVERLHRQLKASLKARTTTANWMAELPIVLLGIRSSWRVDPGCSPAELVYGTTLRLPGECLQPVDARTLQPDSSFVKNLQISMRNTKPSIPKYHGNDKPYVPSNLAAAEYVYVRHDAHRHPLQRPYDGPYRVSKRHDKYFVLHMNGKLEKVTIDRLKAAYVTRFNDNEESSRRSFKAKSFRSKQDKASVPERNQPTVTRSGRISRPPDRLYSA